jgi:hypothetical protein
VYGCNIWSVILRGRTLVKNVLLKKIFGHQRAQLKETRENYLLMGFMLCSFYQISFARTMRRTGNVACMGEKKSTYRDLVDKPEG